MPQFYLRLFAADPNRRRIHVFNLSRRQAFQGVGLKDQCYRNRFHGQTDEVENALAELEGLLAPVLRRVICGSRLPPHGSEDHAMLVLFVTYQMLRTAREAERTNERLDKMMKKVMSHERRFEGVDLDEVRIGYNNPVMVGLQMAPHIAPYLSDLRLNLICAPDNSGFVTSDHPVFKYNQHYEGLKGFSMTGARSRGLQVFVPLSPHHILFLCDRQVYQLRHGVNNIVTASLSDVRALNGMQVVNAEANLYFHEWALLSEVEATTRQFDALRRVNTVRVEEHEEVEQEDEEWRSSLVHTYEGAPDLRLHLSFVTTKKKAKQIPARHRLKAEHRYRKTSINPFDPLAETSHEPPPSPYLNRHRKIYRRTERN